jgi:small subunit ribosomal protein S3
VPEGAEEVAVAVTEAPTDDLEKLLAEEEEIERRTREEGHTAPHFKKEVD